MDAGHATALPARRAGIGSRLALIGAAMALAAVNTGNNLIYLLLSLMLALALVGGLAGRRAARRARVTAHLPAEVKAGEAFTVRFEVQGRFPILPATWVDARLEGLPAGAAASVRVECDAGRALASARCVVARRGVHEGLKARGTTRYPFDLSSHRTPARDAGGLVVIPSFDPIRALRVGGASHRQGATTQAVARGACGAGTDLHDLREYAPEDDARHIDWRASARSGRLMIRQFEREDPARRIDVMIDPRARDEASFEPVVSRCAAILDFAARTGGDAVLHVPGAASPLRGAAAMRWLAQARPAISSPMSAGVADAAGAPAATAPRTGSERIDVSADPSRCTPIEVRS